MIISENISLKPYNTFGIDAKARCFVDLLSDDDVTGFLKEKDKFPKPLLFLGSGSNVLFRKDFDGTVLRILTKGIDIRKEEGDRLFVNAAAGEIWDDFVSYTVGKGWGGLENLSLIPGMVGTAPVQNIGAYGVELKDVLHELEAVGVDNPEPRIFTNAECEFGYRESIFKRKLKNKYLIVNVTFRLDKIPVLKLDYGTIRQELNRKNIDHPTLAQVRELVSSIRRSKLPDPSVTGNAGSFFKNPVIPGGKFLELKDKFPEIVSFPQGDHFKIAAAWLIEQCGWKGKRIGDAGVHENQSLVLINYGSAAGDEILDLAEQIKRSVREKFGIVLEPEVNIIG